MRKILLYGKIKVNCYIIEDNKECYIVDPGFEREKIIKYIEDNGLKAKGILLTHSHIDHIGEIGILDLPIYIYEKEYEILSDDNLNGYNRWERINPYKLDEMKIIKINEETKINVGNKIIEVIFTPGHTFGSVCYKVDNDLYTGDTLFKETVGVWTYPTGSEESMKNSVLKLIDNLDDNINVYPAHGKSSTIGHEKKYNPFYLKWKNSCR